MTDHLLGEISDTLLSAKTVEDLTRPLLALLELVTELEATYLTRIDAAQGVQQILFSWNTKTMQIPEGLSVPWEGTLCKRALDAGQLYADNVEERWGDCEAAAALGIKTYASTPVYLADGALFGTLCAASSERRPMSAKGAEVLKLFAGLIALQIQREKLVDELQKTNATLEAYSFTDPLTGLPNRRALLRSLHSLFVQGLRTHRSVLVAFIDLDGFKHINDTYGHDVGDAFLIEISQRLSQGLRHGDMLGRIAGDEFVLIAPGPPVGHEDGVALDRVRDRLAGLIRGYYAFDGRGFDYAGASIGLICADPANQSPDDALRAADAAMYIEKRAKQVLAA